MTATILLPRSRPFGRSATRTCLTAPSPTLSRAAPSTSQTTTAISNADAQHGLLRPLKAAELSDGTLRYLCSIAALLSPRPPDLMILNEPETSLHPDLLPPLARLIAQAAKRSQIMVVSHASALIADLETAAEVTRIVLEKHLGETRVAGRRDDILDLAVALRALTTPGASSMTASVMQENRVTHAARICHGRCFHRASLRRQSACRHP